MMYAIERDTKHPQKFRILYDGKPAVEIVAGNAQTIADMWEMLSKQGGYRADDFLYGVTQGLLYPILASNPPRMTADTLPPRHYRLAEKTQIDTAQGNTQGGTHTGRVPSPNDNSKKR